MKIFHAFLLSFLISSNSYNADWSWVDEPLLKDENRYNIRVNFFEGDRPYGSKAIRDMNLFLYVGSSFEDIKEQILKRHPDLKDCELRIQGLFPVKWGGMLDITNRNFDDLVENPIFDVYFLKKEKQENKSKQEDKSTQTDDESTASKL